MSVQDQTATESPLGLFHPQVRGWFEEEIGQPTAAQASAWPRIAQGEHVLVSAPTGSGKTLTAFLWALDRLFTGTWPSERVNVLYVSPLRALNADIERNLQRPLEGIRTRFELAGLTSPRIRVMTRSGDTSQQERRKMLRHPPEILVTTPESLNILLTSQGGRGLLGDIQAVILDEIHALAGSKRGTHLLTAIERLVPMSGEFQRIALSATVRPMSKVAAMIGGYRLRGEPGAATFEARRVATIRSTDSKVYDVKVRYPLSTENELDDDSTWAMLTKDFARVVLGQGSTLLFANSRRLTEKVTRLLNSAAREELAYSHHGSLSREVRSVVEKRLKDGALKAIVATNSLELGIDIGALDEVILVQTPRSMASAIQRIGRAGHGVGEVSRGTLYPTHGLDMIEAAVVARGVVRQEIEEIRPIEGPLDVLSQVILSMTCAEVWGIDELYDQVRTCAPYRRLSRRQFDLVLDMMTGRYADSRIRELRPRLTVDRVRGVVKARPGSARLIYMAGGTIADRGYFALRHKDSMAKIGDLDEEFVWERSVGDAFSLGAQSWKIHRITHNDVLVTPARGPAAALAPFWRADAEDRDFFFCQKTAEFLERAEGRLTDERYAEELRSQHFMEAGAAKELLSYLREQSAATGGKLPRRDRLLVEHCGDRFKAGGTHQVILHTMWGGTVNRPFAMALQGAWQERFADDLDIFHDDYCVGMRLPEDFEVRDVFALVSPEHVEQWLRTRLESSGFFGSRFRVNAQIALLLPRASFRQRLPLWLNRQRSKKLFEGVSTYGDFPIVVETWRNCLQDEFDLENLKLLLDRVRGGDIQIEEVRTHGPSPLAAGLVWQYTNRYMYEDDTPEGGAPGRIRSDVLQELVHASHLRPRLPAGLVSRFVAKVQRLSPGYAPRPGEELLLWLEERLLMTEQEWTHLLASVERDHEVAPVEMLAGVEAEVLMVTLPGAAHTVVMAAVSAARLCRSWGRSVAEMLPDASKAERRRVTAHLEAQLGIAADEVADSVGEGSDPKALFVEWLRFYGPLPADTVRTVWGFDEVGQRDLLTSLIESTVAVVDELTEGSPANEICDAENLEILLRWMRSDARPEFEALTPNYLPLFLATHQRLTQHGEGVEGLQDALEQLFGYPAPAAHWEGEILPARLAPYYPAWLDSAFQQSELAWHGCGKERLYFAFASDRELFTDVESLADGPANPPVDTPTEDAGEDAGNYAASTVDSLFPDHRGKYELAELAVHGRKTVAEISDQLWQLAWQGSVTTDSYQAVRQGVATRFKAPEAVRASRRPASMRRGGRSGWQKGPSRAGGWSPVETADVELDVLGREELVKDRVRVLLERWGWLCRELLTRESPALRWAQVFRSLRLMELSGEVLAGYFFQGVRGLQFITHGAFRGLRRGLSEDGIFWLNAADPASLCGVDIEGLKSDLPPRLATTHLVYHGTELVLVSKRRGKDLDLRVPADHPHFLDYLTPLKHLLSREVAPLSSVRVEVINGEPAASHEAARRFEEVFRVTREGEVLRLWKRY